MTMEWDHSVVFVRRRRIVLMCHWWHLWTSWRPCSRRMRPGQPKRLNQGKRDWSNFRFLTSWPKKLIKLYLTVMNCWWIHVNSVKSPILNVILRCVNGGVYEVRNALLVFRYWQQVQDVGFDQWCFCNCFTSFCHIWSILSFFLLCIF